jgi:hypothetical protein
LPCIALRSWLQGNCQEYPEIENIICLIKHKQKSDSIILKYVKEKNIIYIDKLHMGNGGFSQKRRIRQAHHREMGVGLVVLRPLEKRRGWEI